MSLSTGARLGPYEIVGLIGQGGMGEVYRARDPRVGRDVAIKTSKAEFSERFEKEARAVAALNHPNICHLYDVGSNYLVMELVEGETIQGPMSVDEVLRVAGQIAAALDAAHEKGIVHRDLKPGNVKITPDGVVKVLDFGLARLSEPEPAVTNNSPTLVGSPTIVGTILGTAGYMAPEQARGKAVDKRADIWAFGVVLYELATGTRLFEGETVSDVLAGVLKSEPDLNAVPVKVRKLIAKCLEKDPRKRLRDIGDWEQLIEQERAPVVAAHAKKPLVWMAAAGVAMLAAIGVSAVHFRERPAAGPSHLNVVPPAGALGVTFMAVSPDGRNIAMVTGTKDGTSRLVVRPIDSDQFRVLSKGEVVRAPFWSPDGKKLAYWHDGKYFVVSASGGPAQQICDQGQQGGSWNRNGVILVGGEGHFVKASATGGCSQLPGDPGIDGDYPLFLPDGNHFLYRGRPVRTEDTTGSVTGVYVGSLDKPAGKRLLADDSVGVYAPGADGKGYLVFRREGALVGQAFDPGSLTLSGDVFKIADDVSLNNNLAVMVSPAENGTLVYGTGSNRDLQLTWRDRSGKTLSVLGPGQEQSGVSLSPDGRRLLVTKGLNDLWLRELEQDRESALSSPPLGGSSGVWSPDGRMIAFAGSDQNLYRRDISGGKEEPILKDADYKRPSDWSRDGHYLLYTEVEGVNTKSAKEEIWVLPEPGGTPGKPFPLEQRASDRATVFESEGQFSPDGRWVAFAVTSVNNAGAADIYVESFPSGSGRRRVSVNSASEPRWRADGKELYYWERRGALMAVSFQAGAGGAFSTGEAHALFENPSRRFNISYNLFAYAPAADGQRILMLWPPDVEANIHVLTNWTELIGGKK